MTLSNSEAKKQHEKCAGILCVAMQAKVVANRNLSVVNRLVEQGKAYDGYGVSIYEFRNNHRNYQYIYERLKKYYNKELQKLISDDYVSVNSLATL